MIDDEYLIAGPTKKKEETMKKADVEIGAIYTAKISGVVVPVEIVAVNPYGGWTAKNTKTGRTIRIKSAQKLREKIALPY